MIRRYRLPLCVAVLWLLFQSLAAGQATTVPQLPAIGPWMLTSSGAPAHWLGHKWQGKVLYEPINVVIIDTVSSTRRQAVRSLVQACKMAGYAIRGGHSSGYQASIDGRHFHQIPDNRMMAFSNARYTVENNHGRIMGPCRWQNAFVFVAAFSREAYTPLASPPHSFVSFTVARDDFTAKLGQGGRYRIRSTISFGNLIDDGQSTTADHDGQLIVMESVDPRDPAP